MVILKLFYDSCPKETLINSVSEMKHEVHGTQQSRHINKTGEGASAAQRRDSFVQSINQHFPDEKRIILIGRY